MSIWEPIDDRLRPDRPRQPRQPPRSVGSLQSGGPKVPVTPTQQEMDIFEKQEMSKSRPQVKNKLNDWYDWLVSHVPKTVKDKVSRVFKTFKDKIMGLYHGVTGSGNQTKREVLKEPEWNFKELEQAFSGAYRS